MRLLPDQIIAITETIASFDADANVYLFGSRTDSQARGGDIDLLILSEKIDFRTKIEIGLKLKDLLGEQRIDLLVSSRQQTSAFVRDALARGIKLR